MVKYRALVEEWPNEVMVYFRELPGCVISAPSYEEAVEKTREAVRTHLKWLKTNELIEELDPEIEVEVAERKTVSQNQREPLFAADLPAPTDEEIDSALNVAALARVELLEVYESVPAQLRTRSVREGEWSLEQHLDHILESEAWYISRLTENPAPVQLQIDPAHMSRILQESGMEAEFALRGLSPEMRSHVFVQGSEEWTAAKVLRRLVGHLREHYPWMVEIAKTLSTQ